MMHDTSRLASDLNSIVSTLCPDVDLMKLTIRLEEVLSNYEIHRKTVVEVEKDIPEKIHLFLSAKKLEGLSSITLEDYQGELRRFAAHCTKAVSQVATSDVREYLASQENLMMSTIGTKLSVLKTFFGWLVQEEIVLRDPTVKVRLPKTPKRLPKGLSIEALEKVRESCKTLRQRALMEVFYSTGCRLSEVAGMKRSDVDVRDMSMRVVGKGDKERVVYLSFKALYHLKRYLNSRKDESDALFATQRKPIQHMGKRAIQREVAKIEEYAAISTRLHPHVWRHTFATLARDNGADLSDLQHLLGHSNPGTTTTYTHVSEERKKQAHKRFHVQ